MMARQGYCSGQMELADAESSAAQERIKVLEAALEECSRWFERESVKGMDGQVIAHPMLEMVNGALKGKSNG